MFLWHLVKHFVLEMSLPFGILKILLTFKWYPLHSPWPVLGLVIDDVSVRPWI